MRGPFRIEGYAIASADGMIADATGFMPDSLKFEADQRFFLGALERSAVVAHGRLSHEGDPDSHARRRNAGGGARCGRLRRRRDGDRRRDRDFQPVPQDRV